MDSNIVRMKLAQIVAKNSHDPSTKVGCVVYNQSGDDYSIGCNTFPRGSEDLFDWNGDGEWLDTKYPYIIHAEVDAIASANFSLMGGSIYTTLFPCNDCAKLIIASGISEVYYLSDKYAGKDFTIAAKILFEKTNTKTIKIEA